MTIYVYPADEWGCGHYRLTWPAQYSGLGDRVRLIDPSSRVNMGGKIGPDGNMREAHVPDDAEAIILQRPTHKWLAQAVPLMREKGVAVIIDMDDDLANIHPGNTAFYYMHPNVGDPDHSWHNVARACRDATLVTVSTPRLAERYGKHGRVAVLPNYVPERYCDVPHEDNETFTWCGSIHSHPNDLPELGGTVANLVREGYKFKLIGNPESIAKNLRISEEDLNADGAVAFHEWPEAVTKSGVTIAPLADTKFNAAKSWLKPLEAMATGVPVAVSPRVEYQRLCELVGVGTVVEKPRNWERLVRKLLQDPARRVAESEAGRAYVKEHLTYERNGWKWAEVWEAAIAVRKTSSLV